MPFKKGQKLSEEWKKKIGDALRGRKGLIPNAETRRKMSLAKIGKHISPTTEFSKENHSGVKHWNWKGGISSDKEYRDWQKNAHGRRRRANGGSHTFGEWQDLKAKYNWTCPGCEKKEPEIVLFQDHIVPVSRGGSNNIENIQPLCRRCNLRKFTRIIRYEIR